MENSKRWIPGVMAAIAALIGLYLVFIAPGYFDATMDKLIIVKTKQATVFASGPLTRLFIGSFYSGIEMLAGLGLIVTSFCSIQGGKMGLVDGGAPSGDTSDRQFLHRARLASKPESISPCLHNLYAETGRFPGYDPVERE